MRKRARERAAKQKKFIDAAIKYTQKLTPYLVGCLVFALSFAIGTGLYKGTLALMDWWKPEYTDIVLIGAERLIIGSVVLGAAVFTVLTLVRLLKKCDLKFTFPLWITNTGGAIKTFFKVTLKGIVSCTKNIGRVIASPFKGVYISVKEMCSFIFEYVKATKKDYCPSIEWQSEE